MMRGKGEELNELSDPHVSGVRPVNGYGIEESMQGACKRLQ